MSKLLHNKAFWAVVAVLVLAAVLAVCLTQCGRGEDAPDGLGQEVPVQESMSDALVIKDEDEVDSGSGGVIDFGGEAPEETTAPDSTENTLQTTAPEQTETTAEAADPTVETTQPSVETTAPETPDTKPNDPDGFGDFF